MLSLILGIVGLFFPGVGIAAILAGRRHPEDPLSKAGIILGWVGVVVTALGCCGALLLAGLPLFVGVGETATPPALPTAPPLILASPTPGASARGYLGIRCEDAGGARVAEVFPDSPAERAGLRTGDIIITLGGEYVMYCSDLSRAVAERPGQTVRLTVLRAGKVLKVDVTLGER